MVLAGMVAALIAALVIEVVPADAQDALICRKRDQQGGPGAQVYHLGKGDDYFNAGPGPDVIYAGPGDDIVNGGRGDDVVYGGPGDDIACGGVGRDKALGGPGKDQVFGEEGNDTVTGGPGKDYIAGQAGRDRLIGYGRHHGHFVPDGRDFMEGSYLPDVLLLGGKDTAYGGFEGDSMRSMTPKVGAALMDGGQGDDSISGSDADDLIVGGTGGNTMRGKGGDDEITGSHDGELIYGGRGDDVLQGDRGGDDLFGNEGTDVCFGNQDATYDPSCESREYTGNPSVDGQEAEPFTGAQPLASISGSCGRPSNSTEWATGPVPQPFGNSTLVRYSNSLRDSYVTNDGRGLFYSGSGPETAWTTSQTPFFKEAGFSGQVNCGDPRNVTGTWTLQFYDPPLVPVTFPGSSTLFGVDQTLIFRAPEQASYTADVTVAQGSISLEAPFVATTTLTQSGSFPLGELNPGALGLLQVSNAGPAQARWSIAIHRAT